MYKSAPTPQFFLTETLREKTKMCTTSSGCICSFPSLFLQIQVSQNFAPSRIQLTRSAPLCQRNNAAYSQLLAKQRRKSERRNQSQATCHGYNTERDFALLAGSERIFINSMASLHNSIGFEIAIQISACCKGMHRLTRTLHRAAIQRRTAA